MGITVSHVLIKWMVHSIEWRNEANCHLSPWADYKNAAFSTLKIWFTIL